jgi:hypothetical protein
MKTASTSLIGLFLALFKGDCQFTIKAVDAASFKKEARIHRLGLSRRKWDAGLGPFGTGIRMISQDF